MELTQILIIAAIALVSGAILIGLFFVVRSLLGPGDPPPNVYRGAESSGLDRTPVPPVKPAKPESSPFGDPTRGDQDQRRQEVCAEMSGNLFAHPCGQYARYVCVRCGKPVCHQHMESYQNREENCLSCARLDPQAEPDQSWRESSWWVAMDVGLDDHDRPTWYSRSSRQRSSESIPATDDLGDDFTAGDEAALINDDGGFETSGWENEIGAS